MTLIEKHYTTLLQFTGATFAVTGPATFINEPATGSSIVVTSLRVLLNTTTTGRQELSFQELTSGALGGSLWYRSHATAIGTVMFDKEFSLPWIVDGALRTVVSVTTASTPSVEAQATYRLLNRRR